MGVRAFGFDDHLPTAGGWAIVGTMHRTGWSSRSPPKCNRKLVG